MNCEGKGLFLRIEKMKNSERKGRKGYAALGGFWLWLWHLLPLEGIMVMFFSGRMGWVGCVVLAKCQ